MYCDIAVLPQPCCRFKRFGATELNSTFQFPYPMKSSSILAIILIVFGVIVFAYQGISYTTREKAVDLGPLQITAEKTHTMPLPPIVGGLALAGGIVLLITSSRKG